MNIEQRCLDYIREHELLPRGCRVLVGVSGGPDSMALLYMLRRWQRRLGLSELGAVAVDHCLRPESKDEVEMVRAWCGANEIPCLIYTAPPGWRQEYPGASVEEAARHLRYGFFEEARKAFGADRIALAHHADDRAETILMDLLSGCGRSGLMGIPPKRLPYVRPLMMIPKAQIEAYCSANGIPFCTDRSNTDPAYKRNRIRHQLLPMLAEEYNPALVGTLARTAEVLQAEEELLSEMTRQAANTLVSTGKEGFRLDISGAAALHPAILRRLLLKLGEETAGRSLSFERVEALKGLLESQSGRRVELPGGAAALREYDRLLFFKGTAEPFCPMTLSVPICKTQGRVTLQAMGGEKPLPRAQNKENVFLCDANCDIINSIVALRTWQAGDTIRRPGDSAPKSLHDLFGKHRIPLSARKDLLVLAEGARVLWVPELSWHEDGFVCRGGACVRLMITIEAEG